jgi:ABC-type cobalt transport system substrate-binding protein
VKKKKKKVAVVVVVVVVVVMIVVVMYNGTDMWTSWTGQPEMTFSPAEESYIHSVKKLIIIQ